MGKKEEEGVKKSRRTRSRRKRRRRRGEAVDASKGWSEKKEKKNNEQRAKISGDSTMFLERDQFHRSKDNPMLTGNEKRRDILTDLDLQLFLARNG